MDAAETDLGEPLAIVHEGDVEFRWQTANGATEVSFESGQALAVLLAKEVVTTNARWWRKDLSEADRNVAYVFVNCSDVFAWACADAEDLPQHEIERLYRMWRRDPVWGAAAWSIMSRAQRPQAPVANRMAAAGLWDVDRLLPSEGQGEPRAYVDALIGMSPAP